MFGSVLGIDRLSLGLSLVLLSGSLAFAQEPPASAPATPAPNVTTPSTASPPATPVSAGGAGGCFQAPAAASPDDLSAFIGNPSTLLSTYPSGGLTLSARARTLAGTSMQAVDSLIGAASNASPQQKAAIGAGLARAARACVATNPQYAALIQQKVAASNLADVVTAFLAASSDVQTAALGGAAGGGAAGGGGAGGIGGGGASNGGSGAAGGNSSTATPSPSLTSGAGGSGTTSRNQTFSSFVTNNTIISPTQ